MILDQELDTLLQRCRADIARVRRRHDRNPEAVAALLLRAHQQIAYVVDTDADAEALDETAEAIENQLLAEADEQPYGILGTATTGILAHLITGWLMGRD